MSRGAFRKSWLVDTENDIKRHRPRGSVENRRFVHVIPKPTHAPLVEIPIQSAEPSACLVLGDDRKDAWASPDIAHIDGAIGIPDETAGGNSAVVGEIFLIGSGRDMQIRDGYQVEVFGFELSHHSGEIREFGAVYGEGKVLVLKLNVEI